MGFFSSPKSSQSSSTAGSVGIATLGVTQITFTLLEKLLDGIQIPFVKGVAGVALEVIQITRVIEANRESCNELTKCVASLLIVVLGSFDGKTEASIPGHLRRGVERLTGDLQETLGTLQVIEARTRKGSARRFSKAIIYHYDNAEKLKGCSTKIDWAIKEFQVTSKVDSCLKDLERHEELRKAQKDLQEGQGEIRKDLRYGHAEIRKDLADVKNAVKAQTAADAVSSNLPSTVMPSNPRVFGRQEYIDTAVELLLGSKSSRLAILGPGGMGKTSVALKIVHDARVIVQFGNNRHWVACEQATSVTLLIELLAKSLKLPSSKSNDRFSDVVEALESSNVPHLFLFDNFETPWDLEGQQSHLGDVLTRIASIPSTSIILTMRGNQQPYCNSIDWSYPLLPPLTRLELGPAEEAFLKISPDSAGDPELHTLLSELDCMPLAITLMAKLARGGETVSQLLSQWESERTKLLGEPGGDRRTSIEVSIKLSLESRAVKANKDAIHLLSILAMLPGGAAISRLPDICPLIPGWSTAIRILLGAALIYHNADKSFVQVLSPIRSYTLLYFPIGADLLRGLRASYYRLAEEGSTSIGKPHFRAIGIKLANEETNMDAILLDGLHNTSGSISTVVTASLNYSRYLYWTQPRTNIVRAAEQITRDSGMELHASCMHLLGDILKRQSQYEAARSALEEAKSEYTGLGDRHGAASCLRSLGDILRIQGQYAAARAVAEEALSEYTGLGDRQGAAGCLMTLGDILQQQTQYEAACIALRQAKSEFTSLGDRLGAAGCLKSLGYVLSMQMNYEAAQIALEEAKSEFISLGNRLGAASCLKQLGDILLKQGRYEAAHSALNKVKSEFTSLGNRLGVANCLLSLSEILLVQSQYEAACAVLEEARSEYASLGDLRSTAVCMKSLGDILWMQGQYEAAGNTLEEARLKYIKLGDRHGAANCLLSLATISQNQDRYYDALNQLEEARANYSAVGLSEQVDVCIGKLNEVRGILGNADSQ